MRSLTTTFAFLFAFTLAGTAAAQDAERDPSVSIELQGRIGGGAIWAHASDPLGIPAIETGNAAGMELGAAVSVRHYGTGLGITLAYTHLFTGVRTQYGTHSFDARLSERWTFFRRGHTSLSFLFEAGVAYVEGGAHLECTSWLFNTNSGCTDRDVSVSGIGGVGALAFQVRYRALLIGIEGDYRHFDGSRALASQDDLSVLLRAGVAFDL